MPNNENINKLIDRLRQDDGTHFMMEGYVQHTPTARLLPDDDPERPRRHIECGTAYCLAGWANLLRMTEIGIDYKSVRASDDDPEAFIDQFSNADVAADWLGITTHQANRLFLMWNWESCNMPDTEEFDRIDPATRRAAAIRVLEILRDTGEVNWAQACADAGIDESDYADPDDEE